MFIGVDIDEKSKHEKEKNALNHLSSLLPKNSCVELKKLYEEYEDRTTETAKFVKDLDRLEMACQAFEYQKKFGIELTTDFYGSVRGKFFFKEVETYFLQLEKKWSKIGTI